LGLRKRFAGDFIANVAGIKGQIDTELMAHGRRAKEVVFIGAFSSREPVPTPDQVRGRLSLENALFGGLDRLHVVVG
jgi:hypothetical protein